MPTYIGFSTINADKPKTANQLGGIDGGVGGILKPIVFGKKFKLTDSQLVIQDLINVLNIPKGQKVGQPQYGTSLWEFIFEPNTPDIQYKIESEIRRVAGSDPRMILNSVKSFPKENGILIEVELAIAPFNNPGILNIFFNQLTSNASIMPM